MQLDVQRISVTAVLPTKGSNGAACYDLYADEACAIWVGRTKLIKTGLRVRVPEGYVLEILPRSGMALKQIATVFNSPGQIDSDYRGEVGVILYNAGQRYNVFINKGDRIAQCRLLPVIPLELNETEIDQEETARGAGGYGHTGA